jgi:hypothetical protein
MTSPAEPAISPRKRRKIVFAVRSVAGVMVAYLLLAYLVLPAVWYLLARRHPALSQTPTVSETKSGISGDPINLAIVASEHDLVRAMVAADWNPADPITLRTSLRIVTATVLKRTYADAPVSNLYVWGKKEDLAFEKPVGNNPRERHHVRFWKSDQTDDRGRPLWAGAATFDVKVGLSHRTGQVTHHIGPDVDADRDLIVADLRRARWLELASWIDAFQRKAQGRNGGGDRYQTDRRLAYVTLNSPSSNDTRQAEKQPAEAANHP